MYVNKRKVTFGKRQNIYYIGEEMSSTTNTNNAKSVNKTKNVNKASKANAGTGKTKQTSSKKKKKVSSSTKVMLLFIGIAILFCIGGIVFLVSNSKAGKAVRSDNNGENPTKETQVIKEFVALENVDYAADISKYYTYGTSLCVEGSVSATQLVNTQLSNIDKVKLVLRKAYTNTDGSINDEDMYSYDVYTEINEDTLSFKSFEKINEGICLENIADDQYVMLLKVVDKAGEVKYCTFEENSLEQLTYYTITKNGVNQKIDMLFAKEKDKNYIAFNVEKSELPEDVYDIVLDPGHGGNDPGAVNGEYNEAVLMLDYAKSIKTALENAGYKVALTRDGSEPSSEKMAYTMYDENGRVNKACKTKAKICLSLHLNSNAIQLTKGGIQIYYSYRGSEKFAKNMVDNVVTASGTYVSPMSAFKVDEGVYKRAFSQADLEEAKEDAIRDGYEPYPSTTDTDYYFMIRELGGIATNAYVDGRNSRYGSNNYRNSINGIESCIMELAFISVDEDLEHIKNNKDGYVEGVVNGINEWVKQLTQE